MNLSFRYAIAAIVMAGALFLLSPTLMPEDVNLPKLAFKRKNHYH